MWWEKMSKHTGSSKEVNKCHDYHNRHQLFRIKRLQLSQMAVEDKNEEG